MRFASVGISFLFFFISLAQAVEPSDLKARLSAYQNKLSRGQSEDVLSGLFALEKEAPQNAYLQAVIGRAYLMKGGAAEAEQRSQRALAADPKSSDAMNTLAAIALNRNDLSSARQFLSQADAIQDKNPRTSYNLGLLAQKSGSTQDAITLYEETIKREPDYAWAYVNLTNVYDDVDNCEKGVVTGKRAVELLPQSPMPYLNLGVCFRKLKQYEQAEQVYKKGMQLAPNDPQFPYNLGFVYDDWSRPLDAEKSYLAAIQMSPQFVRPYVNLGIVYKHLARYQDAIAILEKGKAIAPQLYNIRSELVKVYRLKGDLESANRELAVAQSLDPQRAAKLIKH